MPGITRASVPLRQAADRDEIFAATVHAGCDEHASGSPARSGTADWPEEQRGYRWVVGLPLAGGRYARTNCAIGCFASPRRHQSRVRRCPVRIVVLPAASAAPGSCAACSPARRAGAPAEITVIGNTGDDITLFGPARLPRPRHRDVHPRRRHRRGAGLGPARRDVGTSRTSSRRTACGPAWFGLGDRDIATHLVRTQMLDAGLPARRRSPRRCARAGSPGVTLLPMSDDRVETHVVVDDPDEPPGGRRAVHFQEYWVRLHAADPRARGRRRSASRTPTPGPGVLEAIAAADVVLLPPSQPGGLASARSWPCPGIRDALAATGARRGRACRRSSAARRCAAWPTSCSPRSASRSSAAAVALHYGARPGGLLDGWLVDTADARRSRRRRGGRASPAGPCRC